MNIIKESNDLINKKKISHKRRKKNKQKLENKDNKVNDMNNNEWENVKSIYDEIIKYRGFSKINSENYFYKNLLEISLK